jgi:formimidoylglutamate deiminase
MLAEAERQTPETVRSEYELVFREQRSAGYTAVGEFHYLGLGEALSASAAAVAAGVELVMLYCAYGRGGLARFRQDTVAEYLRDVEHLRATGIRVGLAPHSVRACPRDWLEEIGRYAESSELPLHVHACEQPREIEESLTEHRMRPVELLAATGCLTAATTVIHATHADQNELALIADSGATVCLCPTTEADLGDGFAPVVALLELGIPICIGSDSNVRIDPLEELRQLDGIARRQSLARDLLSPADLLAIGTGCGAAALGLESWLDITVDLGHASLRGVPVSLVPAALVSGSSADALS